MAAADQDTARHDLATGRKLHFRVAKSKADEHHPTPDPDAPEQTVHSGSGLVRATVESILEGAKTQNPTADQERRLIANVSTLAILAEKALSMRGGNGGGRFSGPVNTIMAAVIGAVTAIGGVGLASNDDVAQAKVLAEAIASRLESTDETVKSQGARLDDLEERAIATDRALGKYIQWQIDAEYQNCTQVQQQFARALNFQNRNAKDYEPITIDCDPTPVLPPEVADLRNAARRADTR